MKHILFLLIAFLFINNTFAQKESEISKTVSNNFRQKYNANDYEGIYAMLATS